jgi:predicted HTH transcriptional regulator
VPLTADRQLHLPLPHGLPGEAWLWLKKGTEWIDFRSLNSGRQGVTFDLPEDEVANLSALIATGEDGQLEFKSQLPAKDAESKRKTFKTVAAFAQDAGGFVLFGVEDRTGRLLGISEDEETAKQRFTSMINSIVRPTPRFALSYQELEGKNILVARIDASDEIHSVTVETDHHEYYVRRNATTFYARPEDLARVLNPRTGAQIPPWP